jgi:hypothetical protein
MKRISMLAITLVLTVLICAPSYAMGNKSANRSQDQQNNPNSPSIVSDTNMNSQANPTSDSGNMGSSTSQGATDNSRPGASSSDTGANAGQDTSRPQSGY